MYDPKSEAAEFIGATREEAVAKACRFFGRETAELVVAALPGNVHGAGGRVVVVAHPEGARPARSGGGGRREEHPREPRGDRFERGGGRDRDRGRGDRGRGERTAPETRRAAVADVADHLGAAEESIGTVVGGMQAIGQFVLGVVERLALGSFEIRETEEADLVVYTLRGPAAERLSGGEGRAADALQLVVNQAALRISEDHKRVVVEVEGEHAEREDFIVRAAQRAAKRAQETGRAVALDPMNPRDRRGIHMALRETRGVATMSIGSGRYRQVLVVPEGAPEYEEARRSAESSAQPES